IALKARPHAACLVPEKRQELTTEGGLDVVRLYDDLAPYVARLDTAGIRVSLFIEADEQQILAAERIGAPVIELHTGSYAHAAGEAQKFQLLKLRQMADFAAALGLEAHAGHGLTYDNTPDIARILALKELNIGHFLIGE